MKRSREVRDESDEAQSISGASSSSLTSTNSDVTRETPIGEGASTCQKELAKLRISSRLQQKKEQLNSGGEAGSQRAGTSRGALKKTNTGGNRNLRKSCD